MFNTYMTTTVEIAKGRNAGQVGQVVMTYGKQSVVVSGMGTVYRRSLTHKSQVKLAALDAGVTLEWLLEEMTMSEAIAWLGM